MRILHKKITISGQNTKAAAVRELGETLETEGS